jgi:hypothetical protein
MAAMGRKAARKRSGTKRAKGTSSRRSSARWSAEVTRSSNALDLKPEVFKSRSPAKIAASLKRSAEHSKRRKGSSLQSAMSMLNFYINRAGNNLTPAQKLVLERAKPELRKAFAREGSRNGRRRP